MANEHRVVIIGGGFGGLYAARALKRSPVRVTLLDRRNFHLFQPLLYQVATGGLSPGDIAGSLRATLRHQINTEVILGEATDLNVAERYVETTHGASIPYDSLIIATGATHSYFNHPEWADFAPGLKTIEDATEIRRRVFYAFEVAEREKDPATRAEWLTFLIVGAGPTGVELAGALAEIANETLRGDFRHIRTEESCVILLDTSDRVLPAYPADLSKKAEQQLIKLGVRTRTGVRVTNIDAFGVTMQTAQGESRIPSRTVLWAAGVQASPLARTIAARTGASLDRFGRVEVQPDLTIPNHPEIFVVGDLARVESEGRLVPGVAPAAMQMGRYAARRIVERLRGEPGKPFRYFDKGSLATIGRAAAVADFGKIHISGFLAWFAWVFIHLMYLVGFQNRILVLVQWAFHYLTFNRGARLITGPAEVRNYSVQR